MSRTVQVHRELSLHQISPRWASVLGREPKVAKIHFKVRGMTIDISKMKTCVVGEAHNWNATYEGCADCYQTSLEFARILMDSPAVRKPQLDKFVAHWNKSHTFSKKHL